MNLSNLQSLSPYPVVQVGWSVFEPLDSAIERWVDCTGAGPFFVLPHAPIDNVVYRGQTSSYDHSCAIGQWGDVQLELMQQHCDNASHIREMCPDQQPRLCSISWMVPDLAAETQRLEAMGFPVIWQCALFGKTVGAVWFDARALMGCCIEVFEIEPGLQNAFELCAKAAEGWRGDRPIRNMAELTNSATF